MPNFFRSLILSVVLSFIAPICLLGGTMSSVYVLTWIPLFTEISQNINEQIVQFLGVFGDGSVSEGILVIALACGFVGALFDTYAFYNYQIQKGN